MELLLIRHAESQFNAGETNDLDSSITELGYQQARETGEYLKSVDLTGFKGIVSPFQRTLQTATILQKYVDLDFRVSGGARELLLLGHPKSGNGAAVNDRSKHFPEFHWPTEHWKGKQVFYNVEDFHAFMHRIKLFLGTLLEGDEKFVIVSHASPIQAMHDLATDKDLHAVEDYSNHDSFGRVVGEWSTIKNCSITHVSDGACKDFAKVTYRELENVGSQDSSNGHVEQAE